MRADDKGTGGSEGEQHQLAITHSDAARGEERAEEEGDGRGEEQMAVEKQRMFVSAL
jgi:hypothetical protein